jgi:alpha-glucosidase
MNNYFAACLLALATVACKKQEPATPRPSTAQANVHILAQPLPMQGLQRSRTLRVYLPPDYHHTEEHYPVMYMHDGQNLFDDSTSYAGEWKVDETLNALAVAGKLHLIVVGVDNGQDKRMNELSPWPNPDFGAAEGREYMAFIVNQVKPLIDSTYRTLPGRAHTAIMGSSMGGLISHYAIHQYPHVFSKAGIFSPSYWFAEEVYAFVQSNPLPADARLWILVGRKEDSGAMVKDAQRMYDHLLALGLPQPNVVFTIDDEGMHNEAFWARHLPQAVAWLFAEGGE